MCVSYHVGSLNNCHASIFQFIAWSWQEPETVTCICHILNTWISFCESSRWISFWNQVHLDSVCSNPRAVSVHTQVLHHRHKTRLWPQPTLYHNDILLLSWNCFWTLPFFPVVKSNPLPERQGVLLSMDNVSELSDLPIFLFVVHVRKIGIFGPNGKGVVTTAYKIHCSCSVTASLQQQANHHIWWHFDPVLSQIIVQYMLSHFV